MPFLQYFKIGFDSIFKVCQLTFSDVIMFFKSFLVVAVLFLSVSLTSLSYLSLSFSGFFPLYILRQDLNL